MAKKFADVEVTTTWDLGAIQRAMTDSVRKVFVDYETITLTFYREHWTNWKYKGRPAGAPRLVSWDAWTTKTVSTTQGPMLIVENQARDWRNGRDYAEHVHRSGASRPHWQVVTDLWLDEVVPDLTRDLTAAILASLSTPAPPRKIRQGSSATETLSLDI